MQNAIHRAVLGAAIAMASAATVAAPISYKTESFEVAGVLQEAAGPEERCPSQYGGTITGHGSSALLGRLAFVATDCITPSGPLFTFDKGRFIIMTTSGEQIFASYSGQFVPTGQGAQYIFSGATFQITGGTGRYLLASGGGSLQGNEDMLTGVGALKLTGKISYWTR
jgi:hypothetical protein